MSKDKDAAKILALETKIAQLKNVLNRIKAEAEFSKVQPRRYDIVNIINEALKEE